MARKRITTPKLIERKIEVKAQPETMRGRYSNHVQIGFTEDEFVLDFYAVGGEFAQHLQRIFMSPGHARKFSEVLQRQLVKSEGSHGSGKAEKKRTSGASKESRRKGT